MAGDDKLLKSLGFFFFFFTNFINVISISITSHHVSTCIRFGVMCLVQALTQICFEKFTNLCSGGQREMNGQRTENFLGQ